MQRRADEACEDAGVLAACLLAFRAGEEGVDHEAGAFVLAESLLAWRKSVGIK